MMLPGIVGMVTAEDVKTETLSIHETVATFAGIEQRRCRGRTARCPEQCGHSGEFARFEIVKYLKYEKPGEYGDKKQTERTIQISDFHRNPTGDPQLNKTIKGLKPDDRVLLSWQHNYVTRTDPAGGRTSRPERPITKLEKAAKEK